MRRRTKVKLFFLVLVVVACAVPAFLGTGDDGKGLFLYCGAGLRPAMESIRRDFTATTGVPVQITYAGSGCLLSMLTFAKSGDLYLPGERYYTDQARRDGHVDGEDRVVAYFVAVVAVQKGNPKQIRSLRDLARPDVRVGIGEPKTVACGLIAKRILEKAGIWEEVKANIDAQGANAGTAMELANAVTLKALDAAITWDAMAYAARDTLDILVIPREQNIDVEIPLAPLAWSKKRKEAERFTAFVASDKGQRWFEANGYHVSLEPYKLPYYGETLVE